MTRVPGGSRRWTCSSTACTSQVVDQVGQHDDVERRRRAPTRSWASASMKRSVGMALRAPRVEHRARSRRRRRTPARSAASRSPSPQPSSRTRWPGGTRNRYTCSRRRWYARVARRRSPRAQRDLVPVGDACARGRRRRTTVSLEGPASCRTTHGPPAGRATSAALRAADARARALARRTTRRLTRALVAARCGAASRARAGG